MGHVDTDVALLLGNLNERNRTPLHDWVIASGYFIYMDSDVPDGVFEFETYPLSTYRDYLESMFIDLTKVSSDIEEYLKQTFKLSNTDDEWALISSVFRKYREMSDFQSEVLLTMGRFVDAGHFQKYPSLSEGCNLISNLWWDNVTFDFNHFLVTVAAYLLDEAHITFDKHLYVFMDGNPPAEKLRHRIRMEIIDMHRPRPRLPEPITSYNDGDIDSVLDAHWWENRYPKQPEGCKHTTRVMRGDDRDTFECIDCGTLFA